MDFRDQLAHHARVVDDVVDKCTDERGGRVERRDQDCQSFSLDVFESYDVAIRGLGLQKSLGNRGQRCIIKDGLASQTRRPGGSRA